MSALGQMLFESWLSWAWVTLHSRVGIGVDGLHSESEGVTCHL